MWHTKCKCRLPLPLPLHPIELFHKVPRALPTMEYTILHPCPIICKSFLKHQDFSSFDRTILFVHHAHFYVRRCLLLLMLLSYGNGYVTLYNVLHYKLNTRKQNHLVFVVLACWSFIMCKSGGIWKFSCILLQCSRSEWFDLVNRVIQLYKETLVIRFDFALI